MALATGDARPRVRVAARAALLDLVDAGSLAAPTVAGVVVEALRSLGLGGGGGPVGSAVALAGVLGVLGDLIQLGVVDAPGADEAPSAEDVLELLLPALEHKVAAVRAAAVGAYAALYRSVAGRGGDTGLLGACVARLRPALRTALADAVAVAGPIVGRAGGGGDAGGGEGDVASPAAASGDASPPAPVERPMTARAGGRGGGGGGGGAGGGGAELVALASGDAGAALERAFGGGLGGSLGSADGAARAEALWGVASRVRAATGGAGGGVAGPWEACMLLVRAGVLDEEPVVVEAALDVALALTGDSARPDPAAAALVVVGGSVSGGGRGARGVVRALNSGGGECLELDDGGDGGAAGIGGDGGGEEEGVPVVVPWSSWDARLVMGTVAKAAVDAAGGSRSPRARAAALRVVCALAGAAPGAFTALSRHVLAPLEAPRVPGGGVLVTPEIVARVAAGTAALLARLRMLRAMQRVAAAGVLAAARPDGDRSAPVSRASLAALPLDGVMAFAARALHAPSYLARRLAADVVLAAVREAAASGPAGARLRGVGRGGGGRALRCVKLALLVFMRLVVGYIILYALVFDFCCACAGLQAVRAIVAAAEPETRARLGPVMHVVNAAGDDSDGDASGAPGRGRGGGEDASLGGVRLSSFSWGVSKALPSADVGGRGMGRRARCLADGTRAGIVLDDDADRASALAAGEGNPSSAPTANFAKPFTPLTMPRYAPSAPGGDNGSSGGLDGGLSPVGGGGGGVPPMSPVARAGRRVGGDVPASPLGRPPRHSPEDATAGGALLDAPPRLGAPPRPVAGRRAGAGGGVAGGGGDGAASSDDDIGPGQLGMARQWSPLVAPGEAEAPPASWLPAAAKPAAAEAGGAAKGPPPRRFGRRANAGGEEGDA